MFSVTPVNYQPMCVFCVPPELSQPGANGLGGVSTDHRLHPQLPGQLLSTAHCSCMYL